MADAKEAVSQAKGLAGRAWGVSKWLMKYGLISTAALAAISVVDGGSTAMAATFNSVSGAATAGDFGLGNTIIPMVTEGLGEGADFITGALQEFSSWLSDATGNIPEVS